MKSNTLKLAGLITVTAAVAATVGAVITRIVDANRCSKCLGCCADCDDEEEYYEDEDEYDEDEYDEDEDDADIYD